MKKNKLNKNIIWIIIALVTISFIGWDFANSYKQYAEEGTFRLESEFDAISSATVNVAIVPSDYEELSKQVDRNADPDFDHIQEMVDTAIALQGGFKWIIDKGDKVMIKVNLVESESPSGMGENTDVRVVKALIKNIHEYTEGDVEIIVAEGTARSNDDPTSSTSVWEYSGYRALLGDSYLEGINFSLLNLNQSLSDLIEFDLRNDGTSAVQGTTYKVHKEEADADVYIAVPVLKIHDTGITNTLKLQIGTAPGCYYGYNKGTGTIHSPGIYHDIGHRRWTTEAIVDLSKIADIDFVVVDAIMCLEKYKNLGNGSQVRMNTIVAGADPVAIDHVCARLFSLNPDDIAHITLAEKVGLGTNQTNQINIIGASIEDVKKIVEKNPAENGKWGQSNRTWLLSKTFAASKVTDAAIANEATYIPEHGKDNWSEAVYFFDDRIDLSSYYNDPTGVVSYAFTYFNSPEEQTAELWLGYGEGIIVYLNEEEIFKFTSNTSYGDGDIGDEETDITLKKGQNTLLVKTLNNTGDYSFALNICVKTTNSNLNGNRVDGLKFYTDKNAISITKPKKSLESDIEIIPNPCITTANISFSLTKTMRGSVDIYDLNGRHIANVEKGIFLAGKNEISWNLIGLNGAKVDPGIYVCILRSGNYSKTKRLIIR